MTETLGFLSVRHHSEHGYFGGYLIVNHIARPLEFHCTLPVKPSRAQELLYGPTIDDFVCGEQIAKALTVKAKLQPEMLITDCSSVLAVSLVSQITPAKLEFSESPSDAACHLRIPGTSTISLQRRVCDKHQFSVPDGSTLTEERLQELLTGLSPNFELTEPFQRIREALLEAHPIAKAA